jgi:hypothetical protein
MRFGSDVGESQVAAVEGLTKEVGVDENGPDGNGRQDMAVDLESDELTPNYDSELGGDVRESLAQGVGEEHLKQVDVDEDNGSGRQDAENPESEELREYSSRSEGDDGAETRGTPSESRSRDPKIEDFDEDQNMEGDKGAETESEEQENEVPVINLKAPFHRPGFTAPSSKSLGKRKAPESLSIRKKRKLDDSVVSQSPQGSSFHDSIDDALFVSTDHFASLIIVCADKGWLITKVGYLL